MDKISEKINNLYNSILREPNFYKDKDSYYWVLGKNVVKKLINFAISISPCLFKEELEELKLYGIKIVVSDNLTDVISVYKKIY